jgi:dTDP-4-amino-4,6-dideoxygalactose transaminase
MLGSGMFERILEFEQALAEYTGAPYAVMTDCCTHAIELCLRYRKVKRVQFTAFTYISVVMTMHKLNIDYELVPERWCGEYRFYGTDIWDSARRLEPGMYRQGQMQCLSFGFDKPLQVGRGGAILLDDQQAYQDLVCMRYDGRDLSHSPWIAQQHFRVGYHYRPTPEEAVLAMNQLQHLKSSPRAPQYKDYPDCRDITIL